MQSDSHTILSLCGLRVGPGALGAALMLTSAFLFAVMDCLLKALGPDFRVWDIAFYRFGIGMLILLVIFAGRSNPFAGDNKKLLLLRGVAGFLAFVALIIAIRMIPISTALVLFYAYPAFAAVFSVLVYREKRDAGLRWAAVALGGVAVCLDARMEGGLLGQSICIAGAACAGIAVATLKKARETNGPVVIYLYFCLTGALATVAPFLSDPRIPANSQEWLIVLAIILTSVVAQLAMNEGFRYCGSYEGSMLLTSEVFFVALWGFVFLGETITWRFWVGGTMILGSILALNHGKGRRRDIAPAKLLAGVYGEKRKR
ncbi:MAG: DMT family transporter [Desulfobacteraceae bacterium]|nr:DMT family transporter [Desulfobacteraceae bacterium]